MNTKDHIVHEGRVGVPDPAFPFPKLQPPDLHGEWKDDKYKKAFDLAILHTAWFADEEQERAKENLIESFNSKPNVGDHWIMSDTIPNGPYTVPDMPEWEKVKSWFHEGDLASLEPTTFVRFVKEKEPWFTTL